MGMARLWERTGRHRSGVHAPVADIVSLQAGPDRLSCGKKPNSGCVIGYATSADFSVFKYLRHRPALSKDGRSSNRLLKFGNQSCGLVLICPRQGCNCATWEQIDRLPRRSNLRLNASERCLVILGLCKNRGGYGQFKSPTKPPQHDCDGGMSLAKENR